MNNAGFDALLFGANWDADVVAQNLALYRRERESTQLQRAIAALRDARATLARAERMLAALSASVRPIPPLRPIAPLPPRSFFTAAARPRRVKHHEVEEGAP